VHVVVDDVGGQDPGDHEDGQADPEEHEPDVLPPATWRLPDGRTTERVQPPTPLRGDLVLGGVRPGWGSVPGRVPDLARENALGLVKHGQFDDSGLQGRHALGAELGHCGLPGFVGGGVVGGQLVSIETVEDGGPLHGPLGLRSLPNGLFGGERLLLEVGDGFRPASGGRFALDTSGGRVACSPTTEAPDLVLGVKELGALVLGGVSAVTLAAAQRLRATAPGAVERAARPFATPTLPFGDTDF